MKTFKRIARELRKVNEDHGVPFDKMNDMQLMRKGMEEELKAINLYEKMADQATDPAVRKLLLDITYEEKVHSEEFEKMLNMLDKDAEDVEDQAEEEVDKIIDEVENED